MTKPRKTGKTSWRPAKMLHIMSQEPGYRYRWVDKDPANLDKKTAECWEFVKGKQPKPDATTGSATDIDYADQSLTTLTEYRELVLMRMDEDTAQSRDEYYKDITDRQGALTPKDRALALAKAEKVKIDFIE